MQELYDIEGYEGLYQVTKDGRVFSVRKERFLTPVARRGYHRVRLYGDGGYTTPQIHRLVAKAFIPNPNNYPIVHHKDNNKGNNSVENLEWCTNQQNIKHAYDDGKIKIPMCKGEDVASSKLSEKDAYTVLTLKGIQPVVQIAEDYGVSKVCVYDLWRGRTWKHLTRDSATDQQWGGGG